MAVKIETPRRLRRGRFIHRRNLFGHRTVSERMYSIRYGEQSATHHNSPVFQTASKRCVFTEVQS